jgi:hypothetical protein
VSGDTGLAQPDPVLVRLVICCCIDVRVGILPVGNATQKKGTVSPGLPTAEGSRIVIYISDNDQARETYALK